MGGIRSKSRKRTRVHREAEKQRRIGIYHEGENVFVTLTPELWCVHEASMPAAISRRAGLIPPTYGGRASAFYDGWKAEHTASGRPWFVGYLYNDELPAGVKIVYPMTNRLLARAPQDGELFLSIEQASFKRESHLKAVCSAANKISIANGGGEITPQQIHGFLKSYGSRLPWLRKWLIQDGELPPNVHVAQPNVLKRAYKA